jgi:single-strand DNA-binding protein
VLVSSDALVQLCERYLKKGSKVYIEGQMETRKWQDKSGSERFTTEVTVRPFRGSITLLDSRNESDQDGGGRDNRGGGGARSGGGFDGPGAPLGGAAGAGYGEPEFDDDIPF